MKCLQYQTIEEALERDNKEAIDRGCHPPTLYWWGNTEFNGKFYLLVGEDIGNMSLEEQSYLVEVEFQEEE